MFPSPRIQRTIGWLALGFALCLTGVSARCVVAQSYDEAVIQSLTEKVAAGVNADDMNALRALWDQQLPDFNARYNAALRYISSRIARTEMTRYGISHVQITGDTATSRLTSDQCKRHKKTGVPLSENEITRGVAWGLKWKKASDGWKITQLEHLQDALATALEAAAHEAAQEDLLRQQPELVTGGLCAALNSHGHRFRLQSQEKANRSYRLSYMVAERIQDRGELANATFNIGLFDVTVGKYEVAELFFQKALELYRAENLPRGEAFVLSELGGLARLAGNYQRAFTLSRQAVRQMETLSMTMRLPQAIQEIAYVYGDQNNAAQALVYLEKALMAARAEGDSFSELASLNDIAFQHHQLENYEQARTVYLEVRQRTEAFRDQAGVAMIDSSIGNTFKRQGRYAEAMTQYQKALSVLEKQTNKLGERDVLISLTGLRLLEGKPAEALPFAERALAAARQTAGNKAKILAHGLLGETHLALGNLLAARTAFEEALKLVEQSRREVSGGIEDSQRQFEDLAVVYSSMFTLLLREQKTEEALALAELTKGRVLVDVLRQGKVPIQAAMTAPEKETDRQLLGEVTTLNRQLSRAAAPDNQGMKEQLEKARLRYEDFKTSLYATHPELKIKRGEASPLRLAEMEALLNEKTALLEFAVGEEQSHLFLISLRSGKPALQTFTIPLKRHELAAKTEKLRQAFANRNLGYVEPARELYDLLLKPAAAALQSETRLIIVPDGPLWELPFQALMPAANRFLIEDKTISTAPSLTFLREMIRVREKRGKAATPANILAIGNPALGSEATLAQRAELMGDKLAPLPFAEQQALQIGQLYKPNAKVLTGAAATEATVKAEMSKYRVLHLATHGVLNDRNPMYSHLVLAQNNLNEKEDGLLEARELLDMDLKADLAVLSACETGRGKVGAGEGIIGLTWALFVAGVPSTVVSQWKVADKSTADLMVAFHRQWQTNKLSKATALRQASLSLLKTPATKHPFYWAGFVLVGAD